MMEREKELKKLKEIEVILTDMGLELKNYVGYYQDNMRLEKYGDYVSERIDECIIELKKSLEGKDLSAYYLTVIIQKHIENLEKLKKRI